MYKAVKMQIKGDFMTAAEIINKRKELWIESHDIEQDSKYRDAVANEIIKDEALREEISKYPELLIEMVFVIVDKDKVTTPFFLNNVQSMFVDRLNDAIIDYDKGLRLSMQFLVLKGRQQGFTSLITAYQLACTISRKNFEGLTVADEDGNTRTIFQNKAKYPYTMLPDVLKPSEKVNNVKQLLFDKLNSSWEARTISANMGRSRTINFFHGSESAFWKIPISSIQAGVGEALTKNSIQILESTANGYNEYKDLWDSGKWECCFYEWWHTAEYSTQLGKHSDMFMQDVKVKDDWIYTRCRWLVDKVGLTWEQVYWYYNKWNSYIRGDLIKQEYPCTADEAFLASGACIFSTEAIIQRKTLLKAKYKKTPYKCGTFRIEWNDGINMDHPTSYTWVDSPEYEGHVIIRVYEEPIVGNPYVLGGDTKGEGSDKFTGTIINNNTGKRAATFYCPGNDSKMYTAQMWALGKYYNTALIGIEINFNTYPIELLRNWHYPKQYQREIVDTFTGRMVKAYGWKTDGNTRPLIIEREITIVKEHIDCINDIPTLDEMLTFIEDKNRRPDAESGKHDDLLLSDMIAEGIRGQQTRVIEVAKIDDRLYPDEDFNDYKVDNYYS